MGGRRSTRWRGHTPKALVEETPSLDLLDPAIRGALEDTSPTGDSRGGALDGCPVTFAVGPIEPDGSRQLRLHFPDTGAKQLVVLERVQLGFSSRWYARCPEGCGRRARLLYLVPGLHRFTCRKCAGLEYKSTQAHDSRIDDARRDPYSWWEKRDRLRGHRSLFVSLRLWDEALRRGVQWLSAEDLRRWLFEDAAPEVRAILERLPLPSELRLPRGGPTPPQELTDSRRSATLFVDHGGSTEDKCIAQAPRSWKLDVGLPDRAAHTDPGLPDQSPRPSPEDQLAVPVESERRTQRIGSPLREPADRNSKRVLGPRIPDYDNSPEDFGP